MSTEYVAVLDALKETLNNSNNLTSFASEFVKHYSLYKVVNEKEQNKEFTETVYERNFLREILLLLLERLGRDAREKGISLVIFQKQPPEMFYKKSCSSKFRKIHRKTPEKSFQHRCFPMSIVKFLRTLVLKNIWSGFF